MARAEEVIPRLIFTFWDGDNMPELVRASIDLMSRNNPGFTVQVLSTASLHQFGIGNLTGKEELKQAHLADAVRLEILARFGGIWLDASIITVKPVTAWVNLTMSAMQGFATPWSTMTYPQEDFEGFAVAVPKRSPLMRRWSELFREAISIGFDAFCKQVPDEVLSNGTRDSLPYLTMNAAWLVARYHHKHELVMLRPNYGSILGEYLGQGFRAPLAWGSFHASSESISVCPFDKISDRGLFRELTTLPVACGGRGLVFRGSKWWTPEWKRAYASEFFRGSVSTVLQRPGSVGMLKLRGADRAAIKSMCLEEPRGSHRSCGMWKLATKLWPKKESTSCNPCGVFNQFVGCASVHCSGRHPINYQSLAAECCCPERLSSPSYATREEFQRAFFQRTLSLRGKP